MGEAIEVVPADRVAWEEVRAVFGARGETARCLCQRMRWPHRMWHEMPVAEREERLRAQAAGGGGLVAYLGEEPDGWCAVGPRPGFLRLTQAQTTVPWAGRSEDGGRRGLGGGLLRDAGGVPAEGGDAGAGGGGGRLRARAGGAGGGGLSDGAGGRAGRDLGEMSVGAESAFAAAGFEVVSRPVPRRVVMRVEFGDGGEGSPHPKNASQLNRCARSSHERPPS